jgi:hypothetical protein
MSGESDLTSITSCAWFGALARFRQPQLVLDKTRARQAFDLRLKLAHADARPVEFFADSMTCFRAAYEMAWSEMVDRAPSYARSAALAAFREVVQTGEFPPSKDILIAAAEKNVDTEFHLDAHVRHFGPPYDVIANDGRVSLQFVMQHRDSDGQSGLSLDETILARAEKVARRLTSPSHAAFEPIRAGFLASLPEEPDSAWRMAWENAWWEAWDSPAAAEIRRARDDSGFSIAEDKTAEAGALACRDACRKASSWAAIFAWTALSRSPQFAAPAAVQTAVRHILARRSGIMMRDADLAFDSTYVEPYLAGIFFSFVTPVAVLCAPWP